MIDDRLTRMFAARAARAAVPTDLLGGVERGFRRRRRRQGVGAATTALATVLTVVLAVTAARGGEHDTPRPVSSSPRPPSAHLAVPATRVGLPVVGAIWPGAVLAAPHDPGALLLDATDATHLLAETAIPGRTTAELHIYDTTTGTYGPTLAAVTG